MDVALLHWPEDEARRSALAGKGDPRVLLVAPDADPPAVLDPLEDWVRLPATDEDIDARRRTVARRSEADAAGEPTLDDDGVLRRGGDWVSLPPVEARLTDLLLARSGAVVSREALGKAGWPEGSPGRNALDVHVVRLRRRLRGVGLAIRTVRSRGYLLEVDRDATAESMSETRQKPAPVA